MSRMRYAIIPTSNRPKVARQAVEAIVPQVDLVWVIDNGDNEPFPDDEADGVTVSRWSTIRFDRQGKPPNLSKLWNIGLEYSRMEGAHFPGDQWDVAIINDDAIVPPGWFNAVSTKMRDMRAAAACSGGSTIDMPILHTQPGPVDLRTRLQGFAFIVAGELGLRANEDLHWYFTDDYMDWESRKLGGMVMVPGYPVDHLYPNAQVTPEIQTQIARDAQTFMDIYGMRPW